MRETFESAVVLGTAALRTLGAAAVEIADIGKRVRARDEERLRLELLGGIDAGRALFSGRSAEQASSTPHAMEDRRLHRNN